MFSKSLIKDAATWFKGLRADSIGSWIEFSNVFLKYWGEYKSLDSYLADFYVLKREQNEALPVFNRRFYRVYHDIPSEVRPTETAAMIHYVACLHSELALFLLERKSSSLSQLFENAQEVEENIRASRRIQMQDDSENLQTYEQEDCQYTSDFEQESNEFETNLDQQPEGEYISDSKSDSSVCAEYSRDRYDYEVYDQFANQNKPRITNDRIENYMFLADHNPYHLDISLSSSTEDRSEESNEFEIDLDQQLEVVQLSPEEDSLPFPDLQGLPNHQQNHDQEISNPHHDNLGNAFIIGSNAFTDECCHKDHIFSSENFGDVEQSDRLTNDGFRSMEDEEDSLPFPDLQRLFMFQLENEKHDQECVDAAYVMDSPHFPDLQKGPDQKLGSYLPPAELKQSTSITEFCEGNEEKLQHSQLEQQLKEVLFHDFNDPIAGYLDSMSSMNPRILLSEEDCPYYLFKPLYCMISFPLLFGSRSRNLIVNQFIIWLHWKSSFT